MSPEQKACETLENYRLTLTKTLLLLLRPPKHPMKPSKPCRKTFEIPTKSPPSLEGPRKRWAGSDGSPAVPHPPAWKFRGSFKWGYK